MDELRITGLARGAAPVSHDRNRVAELLAGLEIDPEVTHCSVVSGDGSYTASIPLEDMRDGGVLLVVPPSEGGPIRLRVMDGSTLCWNVKDVAELRFTIGKEPDSVPARPTH